MASERPHVGRPVAIQMSGFQMGRLPDPTSSDSSTDVMTSMARGEGSAKKRNAMAHDQT